VADEATGSLGSKSGQITADEKFLAENLSPKARAATPPVTKD